MADAGDLPKPPPGTRAAGRRLWTAVLADFELDEHELVLLAQAVRTLDTVNALDAIVRSEGPMVTTPSGPKAHPALVEARQQRIVLARIEAALRLPLGEGGSDSAPTRQRRVGARGVYGIRGSVS